MVRRLLEKLRGLPPEWKFHFVLGIGLFLYFAITIRPDFSDPLIPDEVVTWKPGSDAAMLSGTWQTQDGELVTKQTSATWHITSPDGPWRTVSVMINGDVRDRWRVRLERDFSSTTLMKVKPGSPVRITPKEFHTLADSTDPIEVRITPAEIGKDGSQLARLSVRFSAYDASERPLSAPAIFFAPLFPFALSLFLGRTGNRSKRRVTMIGGGFGVLLAGAWTVEPRILEVMWLGGVGLFMGTSAASLIRGLAAIRRGEKDAAAPDFRLAEWAFALGVIGMALWTRWEALIDVRTMSPLHDAAGYLEIARRGTFYQTLQSTAPWIREPLFPALIRWWYLLVPESANAARFLTMLIGTAAVAMAWVAGRRLFSPMTGCIAAFMMAISPFLADLSVNILRDDLLSLLFLCLLCVPAYLGGMNWVRAIAFGAVGGLIGLLRIVNIVMLIPFTATEAVRRRWMIVEALLVFAIAVPVLLPHLAFNFSASKGDLLYSSNVHTRYYYNLQHLGEPGFPANWDEWNKDPYAGEVVPTSALFEGRNPVSLAWNLVRGYIDIFAWRFPHGHLFFGLETLMLFGLLGLWTWWKRLKELWWVAVWYLVFLFPVAVIAEIHLDYRLAAPAAPIILWTWAAGVEIAAIALWQEVTRRFPQRVDQKNILT